MEAATKKSLKNSELFADVEQIVSSGGMIQMHVKGNSMRTLLRNDKDTVELARIEAGELRRGMVVLFRHGDRHILHRIRRIDGNKLIIKGDGNYRLTEYAVRSDVAAYVDRIERNGRSIGYRSCRWHLLTTASLAVKLIRTAYIDTKIAAKKLLGTR